MSTRLQWSKTGLKLSFDVSSQPSPRVQQAYPFPDIPLQGAQLIDVALESIGQTGRTGIRITSRGTAPLPGTANAKFSLVHAVVQGTTTASEELQASGRIDLLLERPMPEALHSFALKRIDAGQVVVWPAVTVTTPADLDLSSLYKGGNLIPNGDSELGPVPGAGGNLVYDTGGSGGYGGTRFVRSTLRGRGGLLAPDMVLTFGLLDRPELCSPDDWYEMSFWICQADPGTGYTHQHAFVMAGFLAADGVPAGTFYSGTWEEWIPGEWRKVIFPFQVPAGAATFNLSLQAPGAVDPDYWFDNLTLTKRGSLATTTTPGVVVVGEGLRMNATGALCVDIAATGNPYDLTAYVEGQPLPGAPMLIQRAVRPFTLAGDSHQAMVTSPPMTPADFPVKRNGTTIGILRIGIDGVVALVGWQGPTLFAVGDLLEVLAPESDDASMAGVGFTLMANL